MSEGLVNQIKQMMEGEEPEDNQKTGYGGFGESSEGELGFNLGAHITDSRGEKNLREEVRNANLFDDVIPDEPEEEEPPTMDAVVNLAAGYNTNPHQRRLKQKIEDEERMRAEARAKLEAEQEPKQDYLAWVEEHGEYEELPADPTSEEEAEAQADLEAEEPDHSEEIEAWGQGGPGEIDHDALARIYGATQARLEALDEEGIWKSVEENA